MKGRGWWQMLGDVARDVAIELDARRAKTALLIVAVTLSTGALVCSVGISQTVRQEIDAGMAASTLDMVSVAPARSQPSSGAEGTARTLPDDAPERARSLGLVLHAGIRQDVTGATQVMVSRRQAGTPGGDPVSGLTVAGLTSGYLDAWRDPASVDQRFLLDTSQKVALVGRSAAQALGVPTVGDLTGVTIWINGESFSVVGSLAAEGIDLSRLVAIPYQLAVAQTGTDAQSELLVRTAPGGGAPVAEAIRLAVRPDAPERLAASPVVDAGALRTQVSGAFDRYIAAAGAFLLAVTLLLIANSMIVSVTARTAEIGLRRAMGASSRGIAALVLAEGGAVGFCGGLGGSAVAAVVVVAVAGVNHWTVAQPVWALLAGPAVGALAGLVSSFYPAIRAARVEPAIAVRSD